MAFTFFFSPHVCPVEDGMAQFYVKQPRRTRNQNHRFASSPHFVAS